MARFLAVGLVLGWLQLATAWPCPANETLHEQIDRIIDDASFGLVAPLSSDGEFLRRVYLDLNGVIPPSEVARKFLDDPAPDKRAAVVDRLLASPQFVRHMTNVLDVMLMERRGEKHVKLEEWRAFLHASLSQNKPWNQLAAEILAADGTEEKHRAAAAYYLVRDGEPNLLTRDVGRMFFGMDLQCAQCHDHPLVNSYYQADYYGLFAFFSRGVLFTEQDKDKKVYFAEKAEGDVTFTSVFTKEQDATLPRLPGDFEIEEPFLLKGDEYVVAPADKVRPIPKYSRRARLAEAVAAGLNRRFNRNIANRLWAHMMGRGLVEPVDFDHVDNPPAHPELLELLADQIGALKYDMRVFLREIALTRAYQRSLQMPEAIVAQAQALEPQIAALTAEQQRISEAVVPAAAAANEFEKQVAAAEQLADPLLAELSKVNTALGEARKVSDAASKALSDVQSQLTAKQEIGTAVIEAATKTSEVATKLPEDQELAQAAAKLQTRAAQLTAEIEALTKTVAEKTPPAQVALDALAAAKKSIDEIKARFDAEHAKVLALQSPLATAHQQEQSAWRQGLLAAQRLGTVQFLAERGRLIGESTAVATRWQQTLADTNVAAQLLAAAMSELPKLQEALAAAQKANDEAVAQQTATQQLLTLKRETSMLVADAAGKAETASAQLPEEPELKSALQTLKARAVQLATEVGEIEKVAAERAQTVKLATEQLAVAKQTADAKTADVAALQAKLQPLEVQLAALTREVDERRGAADAAQKELVDRWSERFFTGRLQALTPEQMAASIMEATGVLGQQRVIGEAEVNKTLPLDPNSPADPARIAEREKQLEAFVFERIKGNFGAFVNLFGHGAGQPQKDFFATVDQALFFANGGTLLAWLNAGGNNLTGRLNKLESPPAIAEEMYISVLTRRPSEQETAEVVAYLGARPEDKAGAVKDMTWALITSAEFRFSD